MSPFAGSQRQESYLRSLLAERGPAGRSVAARLEEAGTDVDRFLAAIDSVGEASQVIDSLLSQPRVEARPAPSGNGQAPAGEPVEGIHYFDGAVFKVQVARQGSGRLYAKRLREPDANGGRGEWEYLGRGEPFHRLTANTLMTREQAEEFGHRLGICCVCGRLLTDPTSVEAGIGPVCSGRLSR